MDAVLPLTTRDVGRARILLRSLCRFFSDLGTILVVVPDSQRAQIEPQVNLPGLRVRCLPETEVAPELQGSRAAGWYKQQVVKLAIHDRVQGRFYLTLDADVVATRPVSAADLTPGGRALSHVLPEDSHPDWYRNTERFLAAPLVRRGLLHNVTPAILTVEGVRHLAEELAARMANRRWSPGVRGWRQRWRHLRGRRGWRDYLVAGLPWTEYALYYSFLEQRGLYADLHAETDACVYDVDGSLWKQDAPRFDEGWDPAPLFAGQGPPWFVVVQSNTRIPPDALSRRLAPFLGDPER